MFFSICKPKKKKTLNQVTKRSGPSSSTIPRAKSSTKSEQNSSFASSSNNFIIPSTTSTSSFYKYSSTPSITSPTSLSSIRESILPEQYHLYDFQEIFSATHKFLLKPYYSSSSSTAWRCTLRNQNVIISQRSFRRQMDTPQLVERLSVFCKCHHSSLVQLKGASISGSYIFLVYEYVPGASLADCLRNSKNPNFTVLSNWMSRIKIAYDIAHGLDYVHNSTGLGFEFVHNHIKSSSIVIAEQSLNAKICHFGTGELCGEIMRESLELKDFKRSDSKIKKFEGTRGYMAPEFQRNGIPTQKSDMYAFGVVILELFSGKEALTYSINEETGSYMRISVVDEAREAVESGGGVRKWMDKRLRDSYPVEVVEKLARLVLDCVVDDPEKRPAMGEVVVRISQMFLESQNWSEKMGLVNDFTMSLAPR